MWARRIDRIRNSLCLMILRRGEGYRIHRVVVNVDILMRNDAYGVMACTSALIYVARLTCIAKCWLKPEGFASSKAGVQLAR